MGAERIPSLMQEPTLCDGDESYPVLYRECERTTLIRSSGDHNSLMCANTLYLLMKDLDQLTLDRVLVALSLHEDQKGHSCNIKTDRCIEVIDSVGPCNFLMKSNLQITHKRVGRANQLLSNELFELAWRNIGRRIHRGRPRHLRLILTHKYDATQRLAAVAAIRSHRFTSARLSSR